MLTYSDLKKAHLQKIKESTANYEKLKRITNSRSKRPKTKLGNRIKGPDCLYFLSVGIRREKINKDTPRRQMCKLINSVLQRSRKFKKNEMK